MKDIFDLKMRSASASEISEKRIQASLMFVTLKKLNRLEKLRCVAVAIRLKTCIGFDIQNQKITGCHQSVKAEC